MIMITFEINVDIIIGKNERSARRRGGVHRKIEME